MRGLFLTLGMILSGLSFAQGEASPPPIPAGASSAPATFVAQGEAVEVQDAGFIITPPQGWEVARGGAGASLLFQAPKIEAIPGGPVVYQSNMRVMVMNEPRPIDNATKDEFSKLILEKGSTLPGATNYSIRSADRVTLQDGAEGFLYYTEFSQSGQPMMQMHILVSSATRHFLMTYTDLASVFEAENSALLTTAYTSMQSAKLDSKPPERWTRYYMAGGLFLALFVLVIFVRVLRGYNMKRLGDRIESEDGDSSSSREDDDDEVSGIAEFKSKRDHRNADEDDEGIPETREAVRPLPKAKKPSSSTPQTQAPRVQAPIVQKPTPKAPIPPVGAEFSEEDAEKTTSKGKKSSKPVSDHEEEDLGSWTDDQKSEVSEIRPQTVTTRKAKPQKVANPAKLKDLQEGDETSDVARLSEILPNTGDTKKKKGLFGWGKGKDTEDRDDEPKASKKAADKDEEPPMSEVAGWNLKSDPKKSRHEDEDDD